MIKTTLSYFQNQTAARGALLPTGPLFPTGPVQIGCGKGSAYTSFALALLSLMSVLAIVFPNYLTIAELREAYGPWLSVIRGMLQGGMMGGAGLALFAISRGKQIWIAASALALITVAQVLGGADAKVGELTPAPFSVGVDWVVIGLLSVGAVFMAIEKLAPVRKDQPILRDKWVLDMKYFFVYHLALGAFLIGTNTVLNTFVSWMQIDSVALAVSTMHPLLQFFAIMLIVDLTQYAIHRTYHSTSFLWRIHAVHHSSEHLDWLSSSRLHILETLPLRLFLLVPVFVLGFDPAVVNIYVVFASFQATLLHANLKLELGWFEHLFVVVRHHHWHHSNDARAHNTNYAAHFPWIDRIFGTFYEAKGWPTEYGVSEKIPSTVLGQAAYPFTPVPNRQG